MHLFRFVPDFSTRGDHTIESVSSAASECYLIHAPMGPAVAAWQPGHLAIFTTFDGPLGLVVGGRSVVVEPGQYVVINAGASLWIQPAPVTRGRVLGVAVHPAIVESWLREFVPAAEGPIDARFFEEVCGSDEFVSPHLLELDKALSNVGVPRRWVRDRIGLILAAMVRRDEQTRTRIATIPKRRPGTREEIYRQVHRARQMMDCSYAELHTLDPAARTASMSYAHFHRCFAQIFGVTPYRYLTERRLAVALQSLRGSERPITHISHDLGFENQSSFNALFRRRFGITPGDYRAGTEIPPPFRIAPRGRQPRSRPAGKLTRLRALPHEDLAAA